MPQTHDYPDSSCVPPRPENPMLGDQPGFSIKDSGKRQEFDTGSKRDTAEGKPRPDLISPFFLLRLGRHMDLGAVKYAHWNWAKGQPNSRYHEAMMRHLMLADMGMTDEDHYAAAAFNLMGLMHNQEMKRMGLLHPDLDDWPIDWSKQVQGGDPRLPDNSSKDPAVMEDAVAAGALYDRKLYGALFDSAPKQRGIPIDSFMSREEVCGD